MPNTKYPSVSRKKPGPPVTPKPKLKEKEPVHVYCRLRPLKDLSDINIVNITDDQTIVLSPPDCPKQSYKFKHIFPKETTQQEIYNLVAFPMVKDLIHGQNGLIFSYGVTSSGKTYTITGTPQEPGILPRTLDTLFNSLNKNNLQARPCVFKPNSQNGFEIVSSPDAILEAENTPIKPSIRLNIPSSAKKRDLAIVEWENRKQESSFVNEMNCDYNYAVFVSYVEIYNNYIYDLLDDSYELANFNGFTGPRSKKINEDSKKRMYVCGVKEVEVKSTNEAFDLCLKGMKRRRIAFTQMNSESSRSHSVFNIRLVQAPLDLEGVEVLEDKKFIHVSQLSIVDLAGCERNARTQTTGNQLREAGNINSSLLTLRNCFDALRDNQKFNMNKKVPYRDSKLTYLFKSFFEGEGSLKMIICINPGLKELNETLQVLKFTEISQEVTVSKGIRYQFCTPLKQNIAMASINFGLELPKKYLENPDDDMILKEWIEINRKRQLNFKNIIRHYNENQKIIRDGIIELEQENVLNKRKISVLQMDLEVRENQLNESENRLATMERNYEMLEDKIKQMEKELADTYKDMANLESEKAKVKNEFVKFKRTTKESWKLECKKLQQHFLQKIKDNELEMEKKLFNQKEKMDIIKNILNNEEEIEFVRPAWMSPIKNEDHVEIENRAPPVANPQYSNSLNTDNVKWIEHRPPGTLELGTVFQPTIKSKKKKSLTNLKAKDFIGKGEKASKYAITHHQATNCGNVETQVFKGQIIPSTTGGAQVIFNDVETLVQSPPEKLKNKTIPNKNTKRLAELLNLELNTPTSSSSSTSSPASSIPRRQYLTRSEQPTIKKIKKY